MMGSSESFGKMKEAYGSHFAEVFHFREHPQQKARITKPFYLGVTEVTQEQYAKVMAEEPIRFSKDGKGCGPGQGNGDVRFPVEGVSG